MSDALAWIITIVAVLAIIIGAGGSANDDTDEIGQ